MSESNTTPREMLAAVRLDLVATITHILGFIESLQLQAQELGQETFVPDLQKIQGVGRQLVELIHELVGDSAQKLEDVDFPRLRFEVRTALNHTVGYAEMLQERAYELDQRGFLPDLDKILGACRQLLAKTLAAEQPVSQANGLLSPLVASAGESAKTMMGDETPRVSGTLLVVDDNLQSRELLGRQLRSQGYRVVQAGSGPSAMERIRTETFDLVLLDVVMPGMNGYEVVQWLKADAKSRDIPVIMIGALNDTEHVVRCIVIGADDYITKPFDPILLKVRVGACLERKRWRLLEEAYLRQIEEERTRSERVLLNMLPGSTVASP